MRAKLLSFIPLLMAAIGSILISGRALAESGMDSSTRCTALASLDLSGVQDAPTQIIATKAEDGVGHQAGYCQVEGYVSPSIGFLLRLPVEERWNRAISRAWRSEQRG